MKCHSYDFYKSSSLSIITNVILLNEGSIFHLHSFLKFIYSLHSSYHFCFTLLTKVIFCIFCVCSIFYVVLEENNTSAISIL